MPDTPLDEELPPIADDDPRLVAWERDAARAAAVRVACGTALCIWLLLLASVAPLAIEWLRGAL